jgi:hypothetical protein
MFLYLLNYLDNCDYMILKYEKPIFLNTGEVACEPQLTEWGGLQNAQ